MRKIFLTAALLFGFAVAGSLMPGQANAMTISTPAAAQQALGDGLAEQVRYVCRRVWRCSYYGCGWRRACYWRPSHRWHRHRHWRRHHRYWW
jgi:hypothetical protein